MTESTNKKDPRLCVGDNLAHDANADDWFAKPQTAAYQRAMQTCMTCPVMQACAEFGLSEGIPDGIFGGVPAAERIRRWGPAGPPKNHLAGLYAELDAMGRTRNDEIEEDVA